MFLEHCPPAPHSGLSGGCLAVEYSRNGEVSRAVPLRLQAFETVKIVPAYEAFRPELMMFISTYSGEDSVVYRNEEYYAGRQTSRPELIARSASLYPGGDPVVYLSSNEEYYAVSRQLSWPELTVHSVSPYPGGDLLVHLRVGNPFPLNAGVARVARDGRPRWFRTDHFLAWPHIIDDNLALIQSRRPRKRTKTLRVDFKEKAACYENWKWHDAISLIDGRGRLLDEIDLLEALLESPDSILFDLNLNGCYNRTFTNSIHHCRLAAGTLAQCNNPTFTNSIHQLGSEVSGANNIAPGDIVASLPLLNAFGIIDQNNRRFKELVRGSFIQQHAVRHLEKARFLVLDSGSSPFDSGNSPSRLLMFDLATGKETILFPRDHTPTYLRQIVPLNYRFRFNPDSSSRYHRLQVGLALSPDRQRVLFGNPRSGLAFELRLSDGRVLNIFRQLHDLSSVADIPDPFRQRAGVFRTAAYDYAN